MALSKGGNSFLRCAMVKHHALVFESKVPESGFFPRDIPDPRKKNPDGTFGTVLKYINEFNSLDGLIRKIEWYDSGNRFNVRYIGIKLYVEDLSTMKTVILDLPLKTNFYDQFTKQMENIDFQRPVEFKVWHDTTDEKYPNKTAFVIKQDGAVVKWAHTTKDPRGMPSAVERFGSGWDYSEQKKWLHDILVQQIMPKVEALNNGWTPDYHELSYPAGGSSPPSDDELRFTGGEKEAVAERAAIQTPSVQQTAAPKPGGPPPLSGPAYDDDSIPF